MPFDGHQFTHALCRVAINYMHQGRALREMVRVVRPGGLVFLRVEGPGFDWRLIRAAPNGRALVCRLRDAGLGATLALTGWQLPPGGASRAGVRNGSAVEDAAGAGRL